MSWSSYLSFLAFAGALVLVPGADFTVILRNTLTGGALRGRWSAAGVASSNAVQGTAAVAGLGAVIVHAQPVFQTIRWAGIAYLVWLAVQALRSAWIGRYPPLPDQPDTDAGRADADAGRADGAGRGGQPVDPEQRRTATRLRRAQSRTGWRQGFLSNITNPKVLVFYLAVLPQFIGPDTPRAALFGYALSHAALSLAYLLLVVTALHRVRRVLARRRVRRALDATTGTVLLGFGARLATEHA